MSKSRSRVAHGNLPAPLSVFIGREGEMKDVKQRLASHRLVTLIGPGGSGKTRLAVEVANTLRGEYEAGVWLFELASLSDGRLVTQTIASQMNVRDQAGRPLIETLADHLSTRPALLVIDNCEHLLQACAQFADTILSRCPGLRILATSRERLAISGESVWTIPPLTLPEKQPWKSPDSPQLALKVYGRSEAVQLFVSRAADVAGNFTLNAENGIWICEICRRLDGMPLAIELAAARVRTLSVHQIAQRLDDRFHLLTGGSRTADSRQQTLAATLDWSYALLSEPERIILQRFSTFSGGATLEAAQAVCADVNIPANQVLDILSQLVEKSLALVERSEGGETRYRLLETIRQYANEKLIESGTANQARNSHLNYFVAWADQAGMHLFLQEQSKWLDRFESEHDNIRAALEWSQSTEESAQAGLRLAAITGHFWKRRGYQTEGRLRLSTALAQKGAQSGTITRAEALYQANALAFYQSDYTASRKLAEESLAIAEQLGRDGRLSAARALEALAEVATETGEYSSAPQLYERALDLFRETGDLVGIGETLKMQGWSAMRIGDYEQAESQLSEGLIACRQSGDLYHISSALAGLGELAVRRGQYERARDFLSESLEINRRIKNKWELAIALGTLGWIALLQGDYPEMRKLLGESLNLRKETGDRGGMAWCLEKIAEANCLQSHHQCAATIFGAASALRAPVGSVMDAADRPGYESLISKVRSTLDQPAFEAAWNEGKAMTLEQAMDYAITHIGPLDVKASMKRRFGGLTEREQEVATWIARGKSNREIAGAMTVGLKTVETYVTRILNKLGFDSRVQIATWAIEKGLNKKELQ